MESTECEVETKNEEEEKRKNKRLKFLPDSVRAKIQSQQNYNKKMEFTKKIISSNFADVKKNKKNNENGENDNNNTPVLPKICLFNQNEKKILSNILPGKEIQKYEKRFEFVDKEKNNLIRKHAVEVKQLQKEQTDLDKKLQNSTKLLKKSEDKNKQLENKIKIQEKELVDLKDKLNKMQLQLEEKKNNLKKKKKIIKNY